MRITENFAPGLTHLFPGRKATKIQPALHLCTRSWICPKRQQHGKLFLLPGRYPFPFRSFTLAPWAGASEWDPLMFTLWRKSTEAASLQLCPVRITQILKIQPQVLVLLLDAQMAPGNLVDDEQQDTADDKTPSGTGCCRGELIAELDPVVFPPAAGVSGAGDTIESRDPGGSEETGEEVADKAANTVDGEDIEAFIDRDQIFVLVGEETANRGDQADKSSDINRNYNRKRTMSAVDEEV